MDSVIYLMYILKVNNVPLNIIENFFVTCSVSEIDKKDIEGFKISAQTIMGVIKNIEDATVKKNIEGLVQSHIKKNVDFFKQKKE